MGYSGGYLPEENKENVGPIIFIIVFGFLALVVIVFTLVAMMVRTADRQIEEAQAARQTATAEYYFSLADPEKFPDVVVRDTFDTDDYNPNDWPVGPWYDKYVISREKITGGVYRVEAEAKQNFIEWRFPEINYVRDFYLEVDAKIVEAPLGSQVGVVFRHHLGNYYVLYLYPDDDYFSLSLDYDGEWTSLDFGSVALHQDGMNNVKVVGIGSKFGIFINDTFVSEVEDDHLNYGKMGVMFGLDEEGDEGVFEFDNFELRTSTGD